MNIPQWEKLLEGYKGKPNLRFLEIGCFEGRATLWLLENILTDPSSQITVIDTFAGSQEHDKMDLSSLEKRFRDNIEPYKDKVIVYKSKSQSLFPTADRAYFDFIYIDGSHEAIDVLRDAVCSWDMLKPGGMIIFDDYHWGEEYAPELRPYNAINGFIKTLGYLCSYQEYNDQVAVFKK